MVFPSRLQDSDDNTSNLSSPHPLPPINSTDSLDRVSSLGRHYLELEQKPVRVVPEESDDTKSDDVFEDARKVEVKSDELSSDSTPIHVLYAAPLAEAGTSLGQFESDEDGANKGDSGIDPGELFVAPVVSHTDVTVGLPMMCGESEKSPNKEECKQDRLKDADVEVQTEHVITPSLDPTLIPTILPNCHSPVQSHDKGITTRESAHPITSATTMSRSSSNDVITPSSDRCCSPQTPSCTSDISLFVPNPSTPWAPPPSPLRSNTYRLSSSLPSSPAQDKKSFRFSMEVQESLFPPFDPSEFISPLNIGVNSVTLRSTPKSSGQPVQMSAKNRSRSLRHSCGHNTPLPTFPEDSELGLCDTAAWRREDGSLCVNLNWEKFSMISPKCLQPISPLHRARSASNPNPPSLPVQPTHHALTLARYSPVHNPHSGTNSTSLFKYYTITPCLNCRLSSSEPNLTTQLSAKLF